MPADRSLDNVCDSVADGTPIDWNALDSKASDEDTRELLHQLRVVAELAGAYRLLEPPESADRTRAASVGPVVADTAPRKWGRYELVEKLGRGTFGTVYRAWDPELERHVAIKLLNTRQGVKDSLKARVLQEGRAIAKVNHPNVVSVLGVEVHEGQVGLCMELVKGKTLDDIVKTQGTLGAQEAAMVGQDVCRALAAVHSAKLVHGDVKARNVMRAEGGRIVLMDFGAGQVLSDDAGIHRRTATGTPIYMAPEALAGHPGTVATDIYSTGVLLFYLVSGRYPVEGATTDDVERAHARGFRRYVTEHRPDLPVTFVRAVEKALDPNPASRHASAANLLVDLLRGIDGRPVVPEPGPSLWQELSGYFTQNVTSLIGTAVLVAFVLGFFNSWAYAYSLGLDSSFMQEGPLSWLRWGFKSMVAPLFLITAVSILALVAIEVVGLVRRVSPAADRAFRRVGKYQLTLVQRTGLTPSAALACLVVALSAAFLAWVLFVRFVDLRAALNTPIDLATTDLLERLSLGNAAEHDANRQILTLGVFGMFFGWAIVHRIASRRGERVRPFLLGAGLATTVIAIVMLDIPYRVLYQNEAEKATFAGEPCYIIGRRQEPSQELLKLFCPGRTPRSVVVQGSDPDLKRLYTSESIFTPFATGSTK
jgi:serine/threonine protein kinase